jgi:hypothetical protein
VNLLFYLLLCTGEKIAYLYGVLTNEIQIQESSTPTDDIIQQFVLRWAISWAGHRNCQEFNAYFFKSI